MNRREFVLSTAVLGTGLAVMNGVTFATNRTPKGEAIVENRKKEAKLRLSSQLGVIPGKTTEEKLEKMVKWGFDGVELSGDAGSNIKPYLKPVKDSGLPVSAICWGACNGDLVSDDKSKRQGGIDALKKALDHAGEIGAVGVIYVPAFNGMTKLNNKEIRDILMDILPAIGEHAVAAKTHVLLEPLNRGEAFFLRQVADGASIARDSKSEGIAVMGDFYHMAIEETDDMGAFISGGDFLKHVHLAGGPQNPSRTIPGQNSRRFVDGFRGLKYIGYNQFCSFECGVEGDRDVEIPKSMAFLKAEWDLAVI